MKISESSLVFAVLTLLLGCCCFANAEDAVTLLQGRFSGISTMYTKFDGVQYVCSAQLETQPMNLTILDKRMYFFAKEKTLDATYALVGQKVTTATLTYGIGEQSLQGTYDKTDSPLCYSVPTIGKDPATNKTLNATIVKCGEICPMIAEPYCSVEGGALLADNCEVWYLQKEEDAPDLSVMEGKWNGPVMKRWGYEVDVGNRCTIADQPQPSNFTDTYEDGFVKSAQTLKQIGFMDDGKNFIHNAVYSEATIIDYSPAKSILYYIPSPYTTDVETPSCSRVNGEYPFSSSMDIYSCGDAFSTAPCNDSSTIVKCRSNPADSPGYGACSLYNLNRLCKPGSAAQFGREPCQNCSGGSYSSNYGASFCDPCPESLWGPSGAAIETDACRFNCSHGTWSPIQYGKVCQIVMTSVTTVAGVTLCNSCNTNSTMISVGIMQANFRGQGVAGDKNWWYSWWNLSGVNTRSVVSPTIGVPHAITAYAQATTCEQYYIYATGTETTSPVGDRLAVEQISGPTALRSWVDIREGGTGMAIAIDDSFGVINVVVAGWTDISFDGILLAGGSDIIVAKWDSNGVHLWTKAFGTPLADQALTVTVFAPERQIFVGGFSDGNLTETVDGSFEGSSAFIICLNADTGIVEWMRSFGSKGNDIITSSVVAGTQILFTGVFGEQYYEAGHQVGQNDVFLASIDRGNGTFNWLNIVGTSQMDNQPKITMGKTSQGQNRLYMAFETNGTVSGFANPIGFDICVMTFDPFFSGGAKDMKQTWFFGLSSSVEEVSGIAAKNGEVWVVGQGVKTFNGFPETGLNSPFWIRTVPTPTPILGSSPSPTLSPTMSASPTLSPTLSPTVSASPTLSPTPSPSPTLSPTVSTSPTPSPTFVGASPTVTVSASPTSSPSPTLSPTISPSPTLSPTLSPTMTPSATASPSPLPTPTASPSPTELPTVTIAFKYMTPPVGIIGLWSEPTDMGGAGAVDAGFSVKYFFDTSSSAALGENAVVQWASTRKMVIRFGEGASLLPAEVLFIKENRTNAVIHPQERTYVNMALLQQPAWNIMGDNVRPKVEITHPQEISYCDSITLSATVLSGLFGRAASTQWTIESSSTCSILGRVNILTKLASEIKTLRVQFESSELEAGARYDISLKVMNYFGNESLPETISFSVAEKPVPSAALLGGPVLKTSSRNSIMVQVKASMASCKGEDDKNLVFKWKSIGMTQFPLTCGFYLPFVASPDLQVPPCLIGGMTYRFEVFVHVSNKIQLNSTVVGRIDVEESPLYAVIKGGSRMVPFDMPVVLDGSASHDPDSLLTDLEYTWKCNSTNNGVVSRCFTDFSFPMASIVTVPAEKLQSNTSYTFYLFLEDSKNRSAVAHVDIYVGLKQSWAPGSTIIAIPEMGVSLISPSNAIQIDMEDQRKAWRVNSDSLLVVKGVVLNTTKPVVNPDWEYRWAIANISAGESFRSLATSEVESVLNGEYVVISPNVLIQGSDYVLKCECWNKQGGPDYKGWAEIHLSVNSPPVPGRCVSIPSEGISMETEFVLSCEGWEDSEGDLPLKYEFMRRQSALWEPLSSVSSTSSISGVALAHSMTVSTAETVDLMAKVFDGYGAATWQQFSVTLRLKDNNTIVNASEPCQNSQSYVQRSMGDGNTWQAVTGISACASEINAVSEITDTKKLRQSLFGMLESVLGARKFSRTPQGDLQLSTTLLSLTSGMSSISESLIFSSSKLARKLVNDSLTVSFEDESPKLWLGSLSNVLNAAKQSLQLNDTARTIVFDTVHLLLKSIMSRVVMGQMAQTVNSSRISLYSEYNTIRELTNKTSILRNEQGDEFLSYLPSSLVSGQKGGVELQQVFWLDDPHSTNNTLNETIVIKNETLPLGIPVSPVITVNFKDHISRASLGTETLVTDPPVSIIVPHASPFRYSDTVLDHFSQMNHFVTGNQEFEQFAANLVYQKVQDLSNWLASVESNDTGIKIVIPSCRTFSTNQWVDSGCGVAGLFVRETRADKNVDGVICSCKHLSDFALILVLSRGSGNSEDDTINDQDKPERGPVKKLLDELRSVLYTAIALYSFMGVIVLFQIIRIVSRLQSSTKSQSYSTQTWVFSYILITCFARVAYYGTGLTTNMWQGVSFGVIFLLSIIPYYALLMAFLLVLFLLWSFDSDKLSVAQSRRNKVLSVLGNKSIPYLCCGGVLLLLLCGFAIGMEASNSHAARVALSAVATSLVVVSSLVLSAGFILMVRRLVKRMNKFKDMSENHKRRIKQLHMRATAFSFGLLGSALISLINVANESFFRGNLIVLYSLYLVLDIACCAFLIYFHFNLPQTEKEKMKSKSYSTSVAVEENKRKPLFNILRPKSTRVQEDSKAETVEMSARI